MDISEEIKKLVSLNENGYQSTTINGIENKISIDQFVECLCISAKNVFHVEKERLFSSDKHSPLTDIRFMCVVLIKEFRPKIPLYSIAKLVGKNGHATIIYARREHENLFKTSEEYRKKFYHFRHEMSKVLNKFYKINKYHKWSEIEKLLLNSKVEKNKVQLIKKQICNEYLKKAIFSVPYLLDLTTKLKISVNEEDFY